MCFQSYSVDVIVVVTVLFIYLNSNHFVIFCSFFFMFIRRSADSTTTRVDTNDRYVVEEVYNQ